MARIGPQIELQLRALVFALCASLLLITVAAALPGPVVRIDAAGLSPQQLTVRAGTRIVWEHQGDEPLRLRIAPSLNRTSQQHAQGRAATRLLRTGERWAYRFAAPGTYVVRLTLTEGDVLVGSVTVTR